MSRRRSTVSRIVPEIPGRFIRISCARQRPAKTKTGHDGSKKMKAAIYRRYGAPDVVQMEDVAQPVPKDNEILVRVRATTVCATDSLVRRADYFSRSMKALKRGGTYVLIAGPF